MFKTSHLSYLRFILVVLLLTSPFSSFSADEVTQTEAAQENTEQTKRHNPNDEITKHFIDVDGRPLHFVEVYKDKDKGPKSLVIFVHGTPGGLA